MSFVIMCICVWYVCVVMYVSSKYVVCMGAYESVCMYACMCVCVVCVVCIEYVCSM